MLMYGNRDDAPLNGCKQGSSSTHFVSRIHRRLILLSLATIVTVTYSKPVSTVAADDAVVGFVLKVSGNWVAVDGKKERPIAGGDQLAGGIIIRPAKPADPSFLDFCLYDGKTTRYEKEQTLPARAKESRANRFFSAVVGRYRGSAQQAASRGQDQLVLDGVIAWNEKQADLTPIMGDLPDGTWSFRVRKPGLADKQEKTTATDLATVTVIWRAGDKAFVPVGELKPGLYELQVINPRTKRTIGAAAVAYFCPSDSFEKNREAYKEARELTESWSEDIQDNVAVPFLRAFLEDLASAGPTKGGRSDLP